MQRFSWLDACCCAALLLFWHCRTAFAASGSAVVLEGLVHSNLDGAARLQQGRSLLQEDSVLEAEAVAQMPLHGSRQGNPSYQLVSPERQCPHTFERMSLEQIEAGQAKPYILGGDQLPDCTNCKRDEERTHFCR